jgi:hypothetical protein
MTQLLGLRVGDDGSLRAEPAVPDQLLPLRITAIPAAGRRWDVEIADRVSVREHP